MSLLHELEARQLDGGDAEHGAEAVAGRAVVALGVMLQVAGRKAFEPPLEAAALTDRVAEEGTDTTTLKRLCASG